MTHAQREFGAPWDTALRVMTAFLSMLLIGVIAIGLRPGAPDGWVWHLAMVVTPAVLLLSSMLFIIRGYRLTRDCLTVQRPGWVTEIDLDGLEAVAADPLAMTGSKRMFANGGLFCFAGRFRNRAFGVYRALATDPNRSVVLRWAQRTLIITPDDPERFVRTLCELRGMEVQRPE